MQLKVKKGITMVTARDGDYHFSYFLWFEDCNVRYIIKSAGFSAVFPLTNTSMQNLKFYERSLWVIIGTQQIDYHLSAVKTINFPGKQEPWVEIDYR